MFVTWAAGVWGTLLLTEAGGLYELVKGPQGPATWPALRRRHENATIALAQQHLGTPHPTPPALTRSRWWVSRPMVSRGCAAACWMNSSMSTTRRSAPSRAAMHSRASRTWVSTKAATTGAAASRRACNQAAQGSSWRKAVVPASVSGSPAAAGAAATGSAAGAASAAAAASGAAGRAAGGSLMRVCWDSTLRSDSKFLRCPSRAPVGRAKRNQLVAGATVGWPQLA